MSSEPSKPVFKVGDSVRFTDAYRIHFNSNDKETKVVGRIVLVAGGVTIIFRGAKKVYAKEGSSGDDGYIPQYSSKWLEMAN